MDRTENNLKEAFMNSIIDKYGYMLTVENICEILQVSRPAVDRMLDTGVLAAIKVGKCYRVASDDLVMYIHRTAQQVQKEKQINILRGAAR